MSFLGRSNSHRWARRRRAVVVALSVILALVVSGGTAHAVGYKQFTSGNDFRSGDCTMFRGASWTLSSDGTAEFNGVVTSGDNNDAWLMWVDLKNAYGQSIGRLVANTHWDDLTKFVKNLPDRTRQYSWNQMGTYPAHLFAQTHTLTMSYRC
ncbi:DUF6294 family protein [Actinokineospora sp. 24-640]